MSKTKKIIILIFILLLLGMTIFVVYRNLIGEPYTKIEKNDINQEKESSIIEEKSDNKNIKINNSEKVQENNVIQEQESNTHNTNPSNDEAKESVIRQENNNSLFINDEKESSSSTSNSESYNTNSNPNNNSTSINEQTTTDNNSNSSVEVKPWDKLGISEYDYYHKPAWSWQTIDFILNGSGDNACSSREDCRKKCQEYGDKYLLNHDGSYNCDTVNSYSGDYLGEDFSFIEL